MNVVFVVGIQFLGQILPSLLTVVGPLYFAYRKKVVMFFLFLPPEVYISPVMDTFAHHYTLGGGGVFDSLRFLELVPQKEPFKGCM